MLLTIHNLPINIRYNDIKSLLQSKCGLNDVILDNLESDGRTKKVTVGLAEESDAAILVRKINGLYLGEQQLYVENVRQKKASEQPYHSKDVLSFPNNTQADSYQRDKILPQDYQRDTGFDFKNGDRDHIQQRTILPHDILKLPDYMQQHNAFQKSNFQSNQPYIEKQPMDAADTMAMMMNYNVAPMYYVPAMAATNTFVDYGGQAQHVSPKVPQYPKTRVQQDTSFGFGMERGANVRESSTRDWGHDNNRRYGDRQRQPSPKRSRAPVDDFSNRRESRWDNSNIETHDDVGTRSRSPQLAQFNSREPFYVQNNNPDAFEKGNIRDQDFSMNRDPGYGQRSQGRTETFSSNAFGGPMMSGPVDHLPTSNAYGSHVTKQTVRAAPTPVWESRRDERNQWEDPQPSQTLRIRDRLRRDEPPRRTDAFKPHNDRGSPRVEPEKSQFRNSDRGGPRPVENRRQQTNTTRGPPTKRFPDRRNERDEPQPKKFAASKPLVGIPKPWMQSSQNSQNVSSKPGKGWKGALLPTPGPFRVNTPASQPRSGPNIPPGGEPPFQQNNWGKPTKTLSLSSMLSRDRTWRSQAAAQIAKDMLKNLEISNVGPKDQILTRLKSTIRSRIEVILGDQLSVPILDLVQRYRVKYPPTGDRVFFLAVLEEIKRDDNGEGGTKEKQPDVAPTLDKTQVAQNKKAAEDMIARVKKVVKPVKVPILKPVPASAKLPKYINADKGTYNQIKQIQKLEMEEGNLYELPPDMQKALDDECDVLCDLFMAECEVPDNAQEKAICEKISDQAADDFRKLVRLNITKRLLDVNTNLMVRIFGEGRTPQRRSLEAFLKQYGVLSLKKSAKSKMYVAHCNSYGNYDALCTDGPYEIDGIRVQCKPLNVTGPPQKVTRAQVLEQREKRIKDQIDCKGESLLKTSEREAEKTGQNEENMGQESEKMGQDQEKMRQNQEKVGQEPEKAGQEPEQSGQEPEQAEEKVGQEQDYRDEDEIDQDLEDVVKEYANLENDYVLEDEENEDVKSEYAIKEETFELDDNDLEDY